jgi:hypothetical protein
MDNFYGSINNEVVGRLGQTCFYEALSQAVLLSQLHLLTVNELTIALYVDFSNEDYFIFDSHQRGSDGLVDAQGAAVLLRFDSFDELMLYIFEVYSGYLYELTPVFTSVSDQTESGNVEQSVNYNPEALNAVNTVRLGSVNNEHEIYTATKLVQDDQYNESNTYLVQNNSLRPDGDDQSLANDHSYFSRTPKRGQKRRNQFRNKQMPTLFAENFDAQNHNNTIVLECDGVQFSGNDSFMLPVGLVCNVSTSVNLTFLNYEQDGRHNVGYEQAVRLCPIHTCKSCNRFLYADQVVHLITCTEVSTILDVNESSELCRTCKNCIAQNKIPSISLHGNLLYVGETPTELKGLTSLEKKLISKINVFRTNCVIIHLPSTNPLSFQKTEITST